MTTPDTEAIGTLVNMAVQHGDVTISHEGAKGCRCGMCYETVIRVKTVYYDDKIKKYVDLETELYRGEDTFTELAKFLDKLTDEEIKTKIKRTEEDYDKTKANTQERDDNSPN
jgi:hypothetical protein